MRTGDHCEIPKPNILDNLFYVIHTTGILVDIQLLGFMSYNSSYSLNSMGLLCLLQGLKLLNKSLIFSWTRNASKFCDGKLSNQRNSLFLSVGTSFIWPWSQQLSISQTIFLPFVFIPFQSSIYQSTSPKRWRMR